MLKNYCTVQYAQVVSGTLSCAFHMRCINFHFVINATFMEHCYSRNNIIVLHNNNAQLCKLHVVLQYAKPVCLTLRVKFQSDGITQVLTLDMSPN